MTRSKRWELYYLYRSVKQGLNYACLKVYQANETIDWHCIFDAYVFLKDVLTYIVCKRLCGILKRFCLTMLSPLYQGAFIDVLKARLMCFSLRGKECLLVFGILTCLEKEIASKIPT